MLSWTRWMIGMGEVKGRGPRRRPNEAPVLFETAPGPEGAPARPRPKAFIVPRILGYVGYRRMQETPQELAARAILPALRGMVARELVREHHFTHQKAADALGLSRPAVTLYAQGLRGHAIELKRKEDVLFMVRDMAGELARGDLDARGLMTKLDSAATYVLRKGYACELHQKLDPELKGSGCDLCMTMDASCSYFRPWRSGGKAVTR